MPKLEYYLSCLMLCSIFPTFNEPGEKKLNHERPPMPKTELLINDVTTKKGKLPVSNKSLSELVNSISEFAKYKNAGLSPAILLFYEKQLVLLKTLDTLNENWIKQIKSQTKFERWLKNKGLKIFSEMGIEIRNISSMFTVLSETPEHTEIKRDLQLNQAELQAAISQFMTDVENLYPDYIKSGETTPTTTSAVLRSIKQSSITVASRE